LVLYVLMGVKAASAEPAATPGFPEAVVQWGAQKGETCGDIAKALYGSPKYAHLLLRYNRISCAAPMAESITLIAPAKVTAMPTARLRSIHPDVQTRGPGGGWSPGSSGQPLGANHSVQTQETGRADIEFIDRTRVFLAPRTLVVIFDTAKQTQVSKAQPPRVEVQEGEVRAGLAALRGAPVEVAVAGGGQVSAASRDTVIARKAQRTTVAVFDGKAGVTSAGKSVEVPLNHGTRFVAQKPPEPPRPLPPAPRFLDPTAGPLVVDLDGQLRATWEPVPNAASYRVEVAREEDFGSLLVREEVPADVTSFRGEKLPPGRYFLRVRAIDKEDFLGIAATRSSTLIILSIKQGSFRDGKLLLRRNPSLELKAPPGVEIASDDGPFGPVPPTLSLPERLPERLRLRAAPDQLPVDLPIEVDPLRASVEPIQTVPGSLLIRVRIEGRSPEEAIAEAHPRVRITSPDGQREFPLQRVDESHLGVNIPTRPGEPLTIEVLDDGSVMLGVAKHQEAAAAPRPAAPPPRPPLLGVMAPLWAHQPDATSPLRSPYANAGASVAALVSPGDQAGYQLDARGSGTVGPVGLDLALRTRLTGEQATDGVAWTGARLPLYKAPEHRFLAGLMVHAALPTTRRAPDPSLEPAVAFGGRPGVLSWVLNAGGRFRLGHEEPRARTASAQVFVQGGVALQLAPWLRGYAAADGRYLADVPAGEALRAGATLGFEAGKTWFAGLAGRAGLGEPETQGSTTVQLTLGLRDAF
jgi:hypothetical protein